jgi:hypothetical protein
MPSHTVLLQWFSDAVCEANGWVMYEPGGAGVCTDLYAPQTTGFVKLGGPGVDAQAVIVTDEEGPCTTDARADLAPVGKATLCSVDPAKSESCSPGGACVKAPDAPFAACIRHPDTGDVSCPDEFPNRHRVGASANDQRACPDCYCQPEVSCEAKAVLYTSPACQGDSVALTADGSCQPLAPMTQAGSYVLEATPGPVSCTPSYEDVAPAGSVEVGQAAIVCCR